MISKKIYFSKVNVTLLFGNNLAVMFTNNLQPDIIYFLFIL